MSRRCWAGSRADRGTSCRSTTTPPRTGASRRARARSSAWPRAWG